MLEAEAAVAAARQNLLKRWIPTKRRGPMMVEATAALARASREARPVLTTMREFVDLTQRSLTNVPIPCFKVATKIYTITSQ